MLTAIRNKRVRPRERLALSLLGLFLAFMAVCWWVRYSAEGQTRLNGDLVEGIYRSNTARVSALLKSGADPNVREKAYSNSPSGLEGFFRLFKGETQEERNARHGDPIILTAARKGNADIIKLLLKYGANIRVADIDGVGPLLAAAEEGNLKAVKLLLDAGCDINQTDAEGNTPLSAARNFDAPNVVKLLIERGAKPGGSYKSRLRID
jgi:hypothetical protein